MSLILGDYLFIQVYLLKYFTNDQKTKVLNFLEWSHADKNMFGTLMFLSSSLYGSELTKIIFFAIHGLDQPKILVTYFLTTKNKF